MTVARSNIADEPRDRKRGTAPLVNGESAAPGIAAPFGLAAGWMGWPCVPAMPGVAPPGPVAMGDPIGWPAPGAIDDAGEGDDTAPGA